jgi:hypothetical protein
VLVRTEEAAVCFNLSQMAGELVSRNWETNEESHGLHKMQDHSNVSEFHRNGAFIDTR